MAEVNELEENLRVSQTNNNAAADDNADEANVLLPGQTTEDNCDCDQYEVHTDTAEGSGSMKTYRIELTERHTSSNTKEECCSNEVVPFVLDEDFDYDNVVLTPKFTVHEMKVLSK